MGDQSWQSYLFAALQEPWEEAPNLWEMIDRNPHQPWDFWRLSDHPDLTWDFIEQHIHHSWDWWTLSSRDDLDFEVVHRHSEKDWNWRAISNHPNVSLETIRKYPNHFWNFSKRRVPLDIRKKCPNFNAEQLSSHIDIETVIQDPYTCQWNWDVLSQRSDVSEDVIDAHPYLPWNWRRMSYRTVAPFKLIMKYPDKDWDWNCISSQSTTIDWNCIEHTINKPWNFWALTRRKDVPLTLVAKYPDKMNIRHHAPKKIDWELIIKFMDCTWNYRKLSKIVPWEYVFKHPDIWDWDVISIRKDIPFDFLVTHVHLPWNWHGISLHPVVTEKFIIDHYWYPWNRYLLRKKFGYEVLATLRIQRWWMRMYYRSTSNVCIRRLLRDCAELNSYAKS